MDILDSPEFDDEAGIVIDAVRFDKDLSLNFSFLSFGDETPPKKWQLTVSEVREERI
jgi:hypothetical protein